MLHSTQELLQPYCVISRRGHQVFQERAPHNEPWEDIIKIIITFDDNNIRGIIAEEYVAALQVERLEGEMTEGLERAKRARIWIFFSNIRTISPSQSHANFLRVSAIQKSRANAIQITRVNVM